MNETSVNSFHVFLKHVDIEYRRCRRDRKFCSPEILSPTRWVSVSHTANCVEISSESALFRTNLQPVWGHTHRGTTSPMTPGSGMKVGHRLKDDCVVHVLRTNSQDERGQSVRMQPQLRASWITYLHHYHPHHHHLQVYSESLLTLF